MLKSQIRILSGDKYKDKEYKMVGDKSRFTARQLEERDTIIKEYIDNENTFEDMCALTGWSKGSFYYKLRKYNIPPRKVGKRHKKKDG